MMNVFPFFPVVATLAAIVAVVWLILLITAIVFRPKPATGVRVLERLLIVTSVLMIVSFGAIYLLLQARGSA